MKYNLANLLDKSRFTERATALADKGACVELTEITARSLSQNAYLHLLVGIVAMETYVDMEYAKQVYLKRYAAKSVFELSVFDKRLNCNITTYRSTASLNKEEMSDAITQFKAWALSELNIHLPNSQDRELLKQAEVEVGRWQRQYEFYANNLA